jgi:2-keto-4-pentenoate hydratase
MTVKHMNAMLAAAEIIATARRARVPLQPLAIDLAPQSELDGYRIQEMVHEILEPDFGAMVGHKIGSTSAVMQQYLGIPYPCSGGVFAGGVHQSGAALRAADYVRVGVECEIAMRMSRDLMAIDAPFSTGTVVDAIDAYLPAIEIVDNRYADWQVLGAPTLVADDFFAAGCVLGNPVARSAAPDLLSVIGRTLINGVEAGQGSGADVLGHPHHVLAWLANHLASDGNGLRAGEIVLTGSMVKIVWLKAGDAATMEFSGLGNVSVRFD